MNPDIWHAHEEELDSGWSHGHAVVVEITKYFCMGIDRVQDIHEEQEF